MFSQLLIVMIAAIAVTIFAERRGIQAPLLLVIVGLAASFIPRLSRVELEPEAILTVVLPPLLFSAASEFSFVSFIERLRSIINLGVILVIVSTTFVGLVAWLLVPAITLPAAMVLGAVVSPPDAVTAVAIGRRLGLPSRLMTVLKGESLINDAAALTLFTFAVASVTGTHLFISNIFLYLPYSALVGTLVGVAVGGLVHTIQMRLKNASHATVLSVLVPFAAYIVAQELGASGVLSVVAAGFTLGHMSSTVPYAARIQARQFWHTTDALLEAFVFAYIGLQLRFVIEDSAGAGLPLPELLGLALAILAATILIRIVWVFFTAAVFRNRYRDYARKFAALPPDHTIRQRKPVERPFTWREDMVISWTGMRGVVTLAAAAGVPLLTASGAPFPGRDLIQAVAFAVALGTLQIQGLTLPWLIRKLNIGDPQEELRWAEQTRLCAEVTQQAALDAIATYRDSQTDDGPRQLASNMLTRFSAQGNWRGPAANNESRAASMELAQTMVAARRLALVAARDKRQIDDDVMRDQLEQLDLEQAVMANWSPPEAKLAE